MGTNAPLTLCSFFLVRMGTFQVHYREAGGCQFVTEQTKYAQLNGSNAVNMNKWCNWEKRYLEASQHSRSVRSSSFEMHGNVLFPGVDTSIMCRPGLATPVLSRPWDSHFVLAIVVEFHPIWKSHSNWFCRIPDLYFHQDVDQWD